jgi:diamine N-acetyltransferase
MPNHEHPPLKITFLSGQRVDLRPLEKDDLSLLRLWANDPEIRGLTGEVTPTTQTGLEECLQKMPGDTSRVWFGIVVKDDNRLIGECGLLRMFPAWRATDLSLILGDKTTWGKGYGSEAIHLLLDYAFGYLNFHRVSIGVVGSNDRALRFYEKVGFKREGVQRDGYYYNHAYQDFVMMSLLENEFRALHPQGILS